MALSGTALSTARSRSTAPITGVILAGGKASQLGGVDKGWFMYRDRPVIAHVVQRFAPQVDRRVIHDWLTGVGAIPVDFPSKAAFANINSWAHLLAHG